MTIEFEVNQEEETVSVDVVLKREGFDEDQKDFVVSPYFPKVFKYIFRMLRKTGGC